MYEAHNNKPRTKYIKYENYTGLTLLYFLDRVTTPHLGLAAARKRVRRALIHQRMAFADDDSYSLVRIVTEYFLFLKLVLRYSQIRKPIFGKQL